jgi:diacylglycerol kinase (ATP)
VTNHRPPPTDSSFDNPHKRRHGLVRLWHALRHSLAGLRAGWAEQAFRLEAVVALVLLPLAFWLGRGWVEVAVLAGSVIAVMVVELLNTAVESAIDRVGPQWHALSKRAKDLGSAAVLLALLFCGAVWGAALLARFG